MSARNPQPRGGARSRAGGVLVAFSALMLAAVPASGRSDTAQSPSDAGEPPPQGSARAAATADAAPTLPFSTFLGGLEWDEANAVAVDDQGNVYLTGLTLSADFPATADSLGPGGIVDAFVVKVSAGGEGVAWSAVVGGTKFDTGNGIAVDDDGNVYVTGRTESQDFPVQRALQPTLAGTSCTGEPCHDAFVTKLDPDGQLVYSTYLGGTRNEEGMSIAVGDDGSAYVSGNTDSLDFPTVSPFQDTFGSLPCEGDLPCPYDVFASRLAPDGQALVYGTYLGGQATDTASGLAVDDEGNAYVAGTTSSTDFPTTDGAFQPAVNGLACGPPPGTPCPDAFVTKLSRHGSATLFSTVFGGVEPETGGGVAVDQDGRAVLVGSTQSPDLPTRRPVQSALANESCTAEQPEELCSDAFLARFADGGDALDYGTYLGAEADDDGLGVAVDDDGNAYVSGKTDSRTFPTLLPVQAALGGYSDAFVTKLGAEHGALRWSTFLGGTEADRANGIAVGDDGAAHVTGRTLSPDFPTVAALQEELRDEDFDAFLATLK